MWNARCGRFGTLQDSLEEPTTMWLRDDDVEEELLYREYMQNGQWIAQDDLEEALAVVRSWRPPPPSRPVPTLRGPTPAPAPGGLTPAPMPTLGASSSSRSDLMPALGGLTPAPAHGGFNPQPGSTPMPASTPQTPEMSAQQIAEMFGDRRTWKAHDVSLVHRVQHDGKVWVALWFTKVLREDREWVVSGHISLAKMKPPGGSEGLDFLIQKIAAASQVVANAGLRNFSAAGVFHPELAQEHYAWVDLLVSPLYAFCHRLTHALCDSWRAWRRPTFHASFQTWEPDAVQLPAVA